MKRPWTNTHVACAASLFFCLSTSDAAQKPGADDIAGANWRLRSQSATADEPVRSGGTRYRLITGGGQLAPNSDVFEGLRLRPVAEVGENLTLDPQQRVDIIELNQSIALYSYTRRAFIVYKRGPAFSLGFERWEPSREPPMERPGGIYQWEFRSPPGAHIRDHRTRGIVTLEVLGLFNTSAGAFLVYDSKARTLRWRKQTGGRIR